MRVTMIEDRLAALDGVTVVPLAAGETVDVPDPLALRYLERGCATSAEAHPDEAAGDNQDFGSDPDADSSAGETVDVPDGEAKADDAPPENKDAGPAPENKQAPKARASRRRSS